MTAGIETLKILLADTSLTEKLIKKTTRLVEGLKIKADLANVSVQIQQAGSMFSIFFNSKRVKNFKTAASSNQEKFQNWFSAMLERGIYLPPSQFETIFVSAAHSEEDIAKTLEAAEESFLC